MIDLRFLRENPDIVRNSQRARQEDPALVDEIMQADDARRATLSAFENLRAEQKAASRQVAKSSEEERPALLARAREMAGEVKRLQAEADAAAERCRELSMALSNVVIDGVPAGGEDDFEVLKHVGQIRDFAADGVTIRDHLDLGEALGAIDVKRGTKVSGSRFYYLRGVGARLELALLTMAVDYAEEHGFTLMMTPTLVSPEIMGGTGFLGAHADEIYHLPTDELYLTGTSEVALAGYHKNEVLDLSAGPIRYAGWSTCYRREAGSYGKDVRGIIRVHQFNKVEMFSYCHPDAAEEEHAKLLSFEEDMLAKTEMPYRVIDTAAGDLGSSAARKFDCEAYLPSQDRYLEVTSTSNCTTFQARRLAIRYRDGEENKIAATLNGTLATTRWLVPFLENHQQADGSIYIPPAMRPYLGGREVLTPDTPRGF